MFRSAALLLVLTLALLAAGCVAIPTKNEPAAYTRSLVQDAIRLYNQEGRQAAIDH
jgi:starvation-inducible outer membrane lipoprotein